MEVIYFPEEVNVEDVKWNEVSDAESWYSGYASSRSSTSEGNLAQ
jgi:hypothetical protein